MANTLYTPAFCPKCSAALPPRKLNLSAEIANVARQRPDLSYKEIAVQYQVSERTIKRYARRGGLKRKRGAKPRLVHPTA